MVGDRECVGQLDAEHQLAADGRVGQLLEEGEGVGVVEVFIKDLVGDYQVVEAEPVVEDRPQPFGTEEGGVELDAGVQASVTEQVTGDRTNLVGWTSVHCGEGDVVGHARGDWVLGGLGPSTRNDFYGLTQIIAWVFDLVEVPLHVGLTNPGEVIADRKVEDQAGILTRESQASVQGVYQDPGVEVFGEGLLDPELLRPLDIVTLVLHIDARFGDLDLIEGLDRFELDKPCPTQPGDDDVLGELRMRTGGNSERGFEGMSIDRRLECAVVIWVEEEGAGDPEDRILGVEFVGDPGAENLERQGVETVRHAIGSASRRTSSGRPPRELSPGRCRQQARRCPRRSRTGDSRRLDA